MQQKGVWEEGFLKGEIEKAGVEGDEALAKVWKGYTSRWGIGCIGWGSDGRMRLAWERPERGQKDEGGEKDKGEGRALARRTDWEGKALQEEMLTDLHGTC